MVDTNEKNSKVWMRNIVDVARSKWTFPPTKLPVVFKLACAFQRPKSHYRTGKNSHLLATKSPEFHTQKPDADKLLRCALDALTGVVWNDDSQVIETAVSKVWTHDRSWARFTIGVIDLEDGDEKPF